MGEVNSVPNLRMTNPSIFALLVDDINKMSESEQKALWIEINREKLSVLAREIDESVTPHNYSSGDIDQLIHEAKKKSQRK